MDEATIDMLQLSVPKAVRLQKARLKAFYQDIRLLQRPAKSEFPIAGFEVEVPGNRRLDRRMAGR